MRAVVFDMDGVIFDSERIACGFWAEVGKHHGFEDVGITILKCIGINAASSLRVFQERYGEDVPYRMMSSEVQQMLYECSKNGGLPRKQGVETLLKALHDKHIPVALASSTAREHVVRELSEAHLLQYFDQLVCGDMVTRGKPDPEIYLTACRQLGIDPTEAYAIEDSHNGLRAAHAAGMRPIMVPDLLPVTDEMRSITHAILPTLDDVLDLFRTEEFL